MSPPVHAVSWNLTRRCNLECAHCYISACRGPGRGDELGTEECRRVMDGIARVNPGALLILTGGEPLLRPDLPALAAAARERGFTVVVGSNGLGLGPRQARELREHGVQGVSLSLDSTDPERHDAFRRWPGAWAGAVSAARALREAGLDFSIHMTVMRDNAGEVAAMAALARDLGARVLNVFFLVQVGRGAALPDLAAPEYERLLGELAALAGVGGAPGADAGILVRAKCAPQYRRLVWERDATSPALGNYADGACPAGKHYCRITPEGEVTPCPYMGLSAGNVREQPFEEIWLTSPLLAELRTGRLGGRCGPCEFARICGGCRCRAWAATGQVLGEDPACAYEPGAHGGRLIDLPPEQAFGLEVEPDLPWDEAARARLAAIPSFARAMVVRAVEAYARRAGSSMVTPALMAEVRERWGGRFAPRGPAS